MAAKLTFIKKIVEDDVINSYQLILNALFGDSIPGKYDETIVYNKGDAILQVVDNKYQLLICTKDNTTGEFNPDNWGNVAFTELFKDGTLITQNNIVINSKQEGLLDDLAALVYNLAGLLDNVLDMNHIYRENFKTNERIEITNGNYEQGCLKSNNVGIDFELKEPYELKLQPNKFKIKHMIEITGLPSLNCDITFNALDTNPYWFSANDAILNASFIEIPEDFEKEKDVPYALNIKIYGVCDSTSSIKVSDLMVMFI